jgi:hypothetical protein
MEPTLGSKVDSESLNLELSPSLVVVQCPRHPHRPKLGDHRWYSLKALLDWADNLGRWEGLEHGQV